MSKAPICTCGHQMILRHRNSDGKPFYGCAKFGRGGCEDTANTEDEDYGGETIQSAMQDEIPDDPALQLPSHLRP